ncbi:GNAT family N-acetyltransferase [Tateyamaria sp. SN3-11]|uniref:GNAT family N-acetyltransferase n=1 Tax=Tateyamaria sp. SN3-11 TaxID=3092147 RepID=UPI0039E90F24
MRLTSHATTLRRLSPGDLAAFQAYRNDPIVARFQSWEQMDDAKATHFLTHASAITPLLRPGHWTQIAVADSETDALLGDMGLHLATDQASAELGITLARTAQGQGHATRAVSLAVALLLDTTRIAKINAWAEVNNAPSRRLMERTGFVQTGIETTDGVTEAVFVFERPVA